MSFTIAGMRQWISPTPPLDPAQPPVVRVVKTPAAPPPVPAAPAARVDSYAPPTKAAADAAAPAGPPLSDAARQALGKARAARTAIEALNMGVSLYNGAKEVLGNQAELDRVRALHGEEPYQTFVQGRQALMERGLRMAGSAQDTMQRDFDVSATPLFQTAAGVLKTGTYALSAQGDGWSTSVDHLGQATVQADGQDLSASLSDSSSSGFSWSQFPVAGALLSASA